MRLIADSGNIYLESFKIEDVTYYKIISSGTFLEDDGVGGVQSRPGLGFSFNNDGTVVFVLTDYASVRSYPLSTAYDPSSIGDQNSYSEINLIGLGGVNNSSNLGNIFFKSDGTRFYVSGRTGTSRRIFQYDLSTAWNITTATAAGSLSISSSNTYNLWFSPDGTKLIVHQKLIRTFLYYQRSTAWNIAGSIVTSSIYSLAAAASLTWAFAFSNDGFTIYCNSLLGEFQIISLPVAFQPNSGNLVNLGNTEYSDIDLYDLKIYNDDFFIVNYAALGKLTVTVNPVKVINQLNTPVEFIQTGTGYLRFVDNNGFLIPAGTTAQREVLGLGTTRWNTDLDYLECWDGTVWQVATGGGNVVTEEAMDELGRLYSLILG